jgi:hypothetical protein
VGERTLARHALPQGIDTPFLVSIVPRVIHGVLACVTDMSTALFASRLFGKPLFAPTLLLSLTSWFHWYSLPRSLVNSLETCLLAMSLSLWPWHASEASFLSSKPSAVATQRRWMWVRAALALSVGGITCMLRPTAVLVWLPLGLFWLSRLERPAEGIACAVGCGTLAVALGAIADRGMYGEWSLSAWNFFQFNLQQGLSRLYGATPWYWGLLAGVPVVLGVYLLLVIVGAWRSLPLAWRRMKGINSRWVLPEEAVPLVMASVSTLGLSLSPHAEFRFFHPVLVLVLPFAASVIQPRDDPVPSLERMFGTIPERLQRGRPSIFDDGLRQRKNPQPTEVPEPVNATELAQELTPDPPPQWRLFGPPSDEDNDEEVPFRFEVRQKVAMWMLAMLLINAPLAILTGHVVKAGGVSSMSLVRAEAQAVSHATNLTGVYLPMELHVWQSCHSVPWYEHVHVPIRMLYLECSPATRRDQERGLRRGVLGEFFLSPVLALQNLYKHSVDPLPPPPLGELLLRDAEQLVPIGPSSLLNLGPSLSAITLSTPPQSSLDEGMPFVAGVSPTGLRLPTHVLVTSGVLRRLGKLLRQWRYDVVSSVPHNALASALGLDALAEGEDIDDTSGSMHILRHRSWRAWAERQSFPHSEPLDHRMYVF